LAIFGAIVVVAAIILNFVLEPGGDEAVAPPTAAPAKQAPATAAIPKSTKPTNVPTFDVVRINPKGDTVMAGRAKPGSKVEIYDGDKLIGEVTADARGEWVFVPDKPLPPGNRELSLVMIDKDGNRIKSESVVMLAVPKPGTTVAGAPSTSPEQPLALKVPRSGLGGSVVLQRPRADGSVPGPLTVDTIDYDDLGNLDNSGHAEAGAQVYLYLNNEFLGHATAGTSNGDGISVGVWREKPEKRAAPGVYTLRADQVDKSGKVMARIEVVFARSVPLTDVKPGSFVVVESGNSLWRLARRAYGTGLNYTVIYKANKNQIKDADLIYPGQVFSLPSIN
jgi:nucleoid-associated protein YgaU